MKTADDYRKTWSNKTDDQIIESLGNEVRDKVETIHGLLHDLNDLKNPTSLLELNNVHGDILLEYSKYLQEHGYLDSDWVYEADGENTVEDFINSKKK